MRTVKTTYWLLLVVILVIGFFAAPKKNSSIAVPLEETDKTTSWRTYSNPDYNFSFKYPEELLSNLTIDISSDPKTYDVLAAKTEVGNTSVEIQNQYIGTFEVNAVKFTGGAEEYIETYLPEATDAKRQIIILGELKGIRISNKESESDAYFLYNIFEQNGVIYNFGILSDNPDQIDANSKLLDDILTTVKID